MKPAAERTAISAAKSIEMAEAADSAGWTVDCSVDVKERARADGPARPALRDGGGGYGRQLRGGVHGGAWGGVRGAGVGGERYFSSLGGEDGDQVGWFEEWHRRLECWWLALPKPTQSGLGKSHTNSAHSPPFPPPHFSSPYLCQFDKQAHASAHSAFTSDPASSLSSGGGRAVGRGGSRKPPWGQGRESPRVGCRKP